MIYPFLVVHNASSGNWKLNVMIPVVMYNYLSGT